MSKLFLIDIGIPSRNDFGLPFLNLSSDSSASRNVSSLFEVVTNAFRSLFESILAQTDYKRSLHDIDLFSKALCAEVRQFILW